MAWFSIVKVIEYNPAGDDIEEVANFLVDEIKASTSIEEVEITSAGNPLGFVQRADLKTDEWYITILMPWPNNDEISGLQRMKILVGLERRPTEIMADFDSELEFVTWLQEREER